jgi:hypothetical protein
MSTDFQTTAYELARLAIQSARRDASSKLTRAFPDCMHDSVVPAIDQAFRLCQSAARIVTEMQQIHGSAVLSSAFRVSHLLWALAFFFWSVSPSIR